MPTRAPQIVALGGGGFSMERDSSLLDDYVALAARAPRARACASCRPPPATPTTTSCASTAASPPAARRATCRCSAATRAPAASRTTSPAHLLSQDLIYVGGGNVVSMLGAWRAHGLDAILRRAWRRGHRAVRPLGRLAVLVRAGAQRLPRRAPAGARPRAAAVLQLRPLRRRARAPRGVPPLRRRRDARRLRGRGRRRRCTSAARELERVVSSRADGARLPRRARRRRRPRDAPGGPTTSARARPRGRGARTRAAPPARRAREPPAAQARAWPRERAPVPTRAAADLRDGRRRLHDGADQPAARRLRALARARAANRGSCSCRPPPATRRAQINAFKARFAGRTCVPEHLSLFRLREAEPPAARDRRSSRTSSTSAAARCATCSRSGARTSSTRCSCEAWRARDRARRPERGRDVLVPGGHHPLQRPARAARRASGCSRAR